MPYNPPIFAVVAGNLGTVYLGDSENIAKGFFIHYRNQSINKQGRVANKEVIAYRNNDILWEHPAKKTLTEEADSNYNPLIN